MGNESKPIDGNVMAQNDDEEMDLELDERKILAESENNKNIVNYYKIINNHGVYTGNGATIDNIQVGMFEQNKDKKAVFADAHLLNEWMDENYASHDMTIMFSIIVFEGVAYNHILDAAAILYELLNSDKEREEINRGLTYIMECLGAYRCPIKVKSDTGLISVDVVKLLGENSGEKLLENIWTEYPSLHQIIVEWLIKVYLQSEECIRQKCIDALRWIAVTDEYFFSYQMTDLIGLEKNIDVDLMFSRLLLGLIDEEAYSDKIYRLLLNWSNKDDAHYLLCCLFVDAKIDIFQDVMQNAIRHYIDNLYHGYYKKNKRDFFVNAYYFYLTGFRRYRYYKTIIEQLYGLSLEAVTRQAKKYIIRLFYFLVSIDMKQVNWETEDVILIQLCFRESDVKSQLYDLWRQAWGYKNLQYRFYDLLAHYEYMLEKNERESRLEEFVSRILHNQCTKEWQKEICFKIQGEQKMGMIIKSDSIFRCGILEKVPVPEEGQCYLLYRKDMKKDKSEWVDKSLVIGSGEKCSSAMVRHGGYNQQVVLSYETNTIKSSYNLYMKEREYKSKVEIELSYQLSDPRKYYFEEEVEPEEIDYKLRRTISRFDGYWSIYDSIEMRRGIEQEVEDFFEEYKGLVFRMVRLDIIPDEAVQQMEKIKKTADVDMYDAEHAANKKINQNELQVKIRCSDFHVEQIENRIIGEAMNQFGTLAPIVGHIQKGEIGGEKFYQYIVSDKEREMEMTQRAYKEDMISHETVDINMKKVFGNGNYQQIDVSDDMSEEVNEQTETEYVTEDPIVNDGDIL